MNERTYKKVDPLAKKSWIIDGIISSVILMAIAFAISFWAKKYVSYWPIGIGMVISFLLIFIHPKIEYKQWGYYISEDRIAYTHGIYYKKNVIIPISKIQHLNISQGPIQKHFGLSSLQIYTAGSSNRIEDILFSEAESIVENLNIYIRQVK